MAVATSGAYFAQAVHEELCLQSCEELLQCAVAPAVQGMQAAVQKGLNSQAASLTEHNDALAQLIALLEQVDARSAVQQSQHSVQQCSAPCVALRQYPILHSSACICAQGSLAGMRFDADKAARHAGRAILGNLPKTAPCTAHLTRGEAIQSAKLSPPCLFECRPCKISAARCSSKGCNLPTLSTSKGGLSSSRRGRVITACCLKGPPVEQAARADHLLCHAGGGLAFMGYLALLCQCLVACGQVRGGGGGGPAKQQYQRLPLQEDGIAVSGQKRPGSCENGSAILELTATAAEIV